jgi:hypothetical protein
MNNNEALQTLTNQQKNDLVRFTDLLLKVSNRVKVSRPNVTSMVGTFQKPKGFIDKLVLFFSEKKSVSELINRAEKLGCKCETGYLTDKKLYLFIKKEHIQIECFLGVPENTEIKKIQFNPSKGLVFYKSELFLLELFGPIIFEAKIYRIDFTIDIFKGFKKILEGLDVKYKSAKVEYIGKGSNRTGVKIGQGNDKLVIYDKSKKEKTKYPWTRIERQLSGPKSPIKKYGELRYSLSSIIKFNPLGIVTLNHIDLVEKADYTEVQREQFNELKVLIKHEGYFSARKKLNYNKNFQRDYSKYFTLTAFKKQPEDIFNEDIINFYKEK